MDSKNTHDPDLCLLCKTSTASVHCGNCRIDLCKDCVEKHVSDVTKDHKVVPLKHRESSLNHPGCPRHSQKFCELHCQQCDTPVCVLCVATKAHKGHDFVDLKTALEAKKEVLQEDLRELEKIVYPKYQDIASTIQVQKADTKANTQNLTTALNKQAEELHKEIDNIVKKMKSDLDEMDSKYLDLLNKEEEEITSRSSEIKQSIEDLKKLLESNDILLVSRYKSRNGEFKKLPLKIKATLPSFSLHPIDREIIFQQFGSLSALFCVKEENGFSFESEEATASSVPEKLLRHEPTITAEISTENNPIMNVVCLDEDRFWTSGMDKVIRLYNLQGELVKSMHTKYGHNPGDLTVNISGNLLYTDFASKSVGIEKDVLVQTLIKLNGWFSKWAPLNMCNTSSDELLVVMESDDRKQIRVVRYSGSTEKQIIQFNDKGQPLYSSGNSKYICENRNHDVCVADKEAGAVVVVNRDGKVQFTYTGPPYITKTSFHPGGIATDSQSRILVADCDNNCVHVLEQDGQFLRYIGNGLVQQPWGLCVDVSDNLFVAEYISGKVKKIQYYM